MRPSVKFDIAGFERMMRQAASDGLTAGAVELSNIMRLGLSKVYPKARKRSGTRRDGTRTNRAMFYPAPPGAYPGKRTGNLRGSIAFRASTPATLSSAAGCSASNPDENTYGIRLEFGSERMLARPWAFRSLSENRERVMGAIRRTMSARLGSFADLGVSESGPSALSEGAD